MKSVLLILFLWSALYSIPECFKEYSPIIEKIDKKYHREQNSHNTTFRDQYIYEYFPTILFPFFCLPKDTVKKLPKYKALYLCSHSTTLGIYTDKNKIQHIQVSVLQYVRVGRNAPKIKTYTMYFLKKNVQKNIWEEDRSPLSVSLLLKKEGLYRVIQKK